MPSITVMIVTLAAIVSQSSRPPLARCVTLTGSARIALLSNVHVQESMRCPCRHPNPIRHCDGPKFKFGQHVVLPTHISRCDQYHNLPLYYDMRLYVVISSHPRAVMTTLTSYSNDRITIANSIPVVVSARGPTLGLLLTIIM